MLELENVSSSKIKVLENCTNLEIFRPLSFEEKINIEQNMESDKVNLLYYLQEEFLEKKE